MSESHSKSPDKLKNLLNKYLSEPTNNEFEIRFGTKGIKRTNKNDFDNVIEYLLSKGFHLRSNLQTMKIRSEYVEPKTGRSRISNIRTEVNGTHLIQKICKHKTNAVVNEEGDLIRGIEFIQ